VLQQAKSLGYDGVEFDAKRPHANPVDWDQRIREAVRDEAQKLGLELPALATNNDFSSPVPEHRECQLLMVREQARLAADLGARVLRLFAAWPGVTFRDSTAHYEEARNAWERAFPDVPQLVRWRLVRECLEEAARFGEEFGVVMALQNHAPLTRHWKDTLDLVREVNSPWLKMCWDLPVAEDNEAWLREGAATIGNMDVHFHYGGEFCRDENGQVKAVPPANYPYFVKLLRGMGYDGYACYEFCHPAVDAQHNPANIDYVHEQAALAVEYMREQIAGAEDDLRK
jgi:sugar phosphate isomerase/epimerase